MNDESDRSKNIVPLGESASTDGRFPSLTCTPIDTPLDPDVLACESSFHESNPRFSAFCLLLTAFCPHVCGTGWARAKAGRGVTTFPEGTHRTGHGALRTTRSISEPSAGAPPNNDA